jgi:hypothetical protein
MVKKRCSKECMEIKEIKTKEEKKSKEDDF